MRRKNMIEFPAKSIRLLAAIGALFFVTSIGVLAMEQQFVEDNCAITIPDTWQAMTNFSPQPGVIAVYCDATGNRRMIFQVINKKPSGPIDGGFVPEFEKGYQESGGGPFLSGKYIEVDGIKGYECTSSLVAHGKNISTMILLVPGEDRYYNIQALRLDGDASEDTEIRQVIDSFRFIHPFVPTYVPSAAYRMGQLSVKLMVIIAGVFFVIYVVRSSLTPRPQPSRPPPLPSRPPPIPPDKR